MPDEPIVSVREAPTGRLRWNGKCILEVDALEQEWSIRTRYLYPSRVGLDTINEKTEWRKVPIEKSP